jgi:tricorn protease
MNLYSIGLDDRKTIRRTSHSEWDAEEASIGGDRIVYTCGGGLWVYDIPMDRAAPVVVDVPTDRWQMRATYVDPGEFVQDITLSKDGKTAAVQARGDLYLIDENRAVNLTDAPESHEIHPAFSPDGKWVAFFSDRDGDNDLYIAPAGGGAWTRLTRGFRAWPYRLLWSPDSRNLCFGDNRYTLYWIGIDRKDLITVDRTRYQKDNEIYWEVSEYDWSPDSKWIAYSKCEANMNSSIFLYGLEERRTVRVTDDRYDDSWPAFDRNGDLLYFLSLRNFEPFLDPFMDNHINANMSVLMAVQLKKDRPPPFKGGSVAGDEDSGEPDESGKEAPEGGRDAVFRIDTAGLGERLFAAPVPAGTYSRLLAGTDGCFFLSREAFGFPDWFEFIRPRSVTHFSLLRFSEKTRRIEEIIHGIGHYNVSGDGSKIAYLSGGVSGVVSPHGERAPGEGSLDWHSLRQRVDAAEEFRQIYRTVCRQVHDFFYDPDMHGVDWDAVRRKHEALIRFASDRSDLNRLIGWTLAELGVSHSYILDAGDESRAPEDRNVGVGLLGADLEPDPRSGRFRFAHVVHGRNWDASARNPLEAPDVHVKPGEYLLALDGRPLEPGEDVFARLVDKAGKYVKLTVSGNPDTVGARTIEIETLYSERELRRSEWVETNYRKVREATSGRVGYIHLSDMDEQGFQEFEQGFRAERYRDALILDVRGNTGGFISWFLLDKLERRPVFGTQTRDFEPMRYPHGTHPGPLVILCDQNTGSDGEVFVELIKKQNLGTVIGTETWGGLVGINNTIPAADGALVTQPNVGFFDPEGSWIVENRGAVPDVILENGPGDATAGRDPQLEKAIAVSLDLLNRTPAPEFKAPKFPSVP